MQCCDESTEGIACNNLSLAAGKIKAFLSDSTTRRLSPRRVHTAVNEKGTPKRMGRIVRSVVHLRFVSNFESYILSNMKVINLLLSG